MDCLALCVTLCLTLSLLTNLTISPPVIPPHKVIGLFCSSNCHVHMVGDGICQPACDTSACSRDGGDCVSGCAPGCPPSWVGNGVGNSECNSAACSDDGGDCVGKDETLTSPSHCFGTLREAIWTITMGDMGQCRRNHGRRDTTLLPQCSRRKRMVILSPFSPYPSVSPFVSPLSLHIILAFIFPLVNTLEDREDARGREGEM